MASPRALPFPISHLQSGVFDWAWFIRVDFPGAPGTQRLTDYPGGATLNIDGTGSLAWTEAPLVVGPVSQAASRPSTVSWVEFGNLDWGWSSWVQSPGIKTVPFSFYVAVWHPTTAAYGGAYLISTMEADEHLLTNIIQITLVVPNSIEWAKTALAPNIGPLCPYDFKDPFTCQYAGGVAGPCPKTRAACTTTYGNQINFGGQDMLPAPGSVLYNGGING
jgi:hypothetical protein